jgi:hypothetical protein
MDLDAVLDGGDCFRMVTAYEKGPVKSWIMEWTRRNGGTSEKVLSIK